MRFGGGQIGGMLVWMIRCQEHSTRNGQELKTNE